MKIRVWKSILISGEAGEDNNNNNINETKYVGDLMIVKNSVICGKSWPWEDLSTVLLLKEVFIVKDEAEGKCLKKLEWNYYKKK